TRHLAVEILTQIDLHQAYPNLELKKRLKNSALSPRDKAFVTALVYGVIKRKYQLDFVIDELSKTKRNKISHRILQVLRIGTFQILFFDKVPSFAAVNECVELGKKYSRGKAGGFVNGLLRNLVRQKDAIQEKLQQGILQYSVSQELFDLVSSQYGERFAHEFFMEFLKESPVTIRINQSKTSREKVRDQLKKDGIDVGEGRFFDYCLQLDSTVDIASNDSFRKGEFIVQDEGAMFSVEALEVKEGDRVLDMCCAPGGKTTHIAERIKQPRNVTARDLYNHKIQLVRQNLQRLGLNDRVYTEVYDGTTFDEKDRNRYDKVLLDAPCSGLGIIRRKPDIKYGTSEEKRNALVEIQRRMVLNGFDSLKPGGILVYTTCTINKNENEGMVDFLLKNRKEARVKKNHAHKILEEEKEEDGCIRLYPQIHKVDGFFICAIEKKENE
ncbi:MAG TPA: 16S rRNA (cytosine(967)-C(5))-methyltransferase RsmB, partial [Eubacteriaceae bacterium]|nr:16S rRNA (cytosine(967)-C(5))-methyltransferase RsmB [Eubacteriaceae bacterium]